MSYIGKSPAVGNFVKLDAISTSSTNTYNLTLDSVAFVPESANHMLVSLNGVIQAPLSSFSVSGSTITFLPSSGTLSSSDSIDFIMVYGNVLDIGTPSDSTVTNAKTNFVSTSSSAGLQIKGDGTTDGTLQLNCSQNSHGIKLKSPPHSASASYTLTFPTTDGNANEFLQTNGSGVMTWAEAGGGITVANQWRYTGGASLSATTEVFITSDIEEVTTTDTAGQGKIGNSMSVSSGVFTFPSTGVYLVGFNSNFYVSSGANSSRYIYSRISVTTDNSSYTSIAEAYSSINHISSATYGSNTNQTLIDVTDTSNVKVKFSLKSVADATLQGGSSENRTYFTFIRLGDT
jgi:hypothetical protein